MLFFQGLVKGVGGNARQDAQFSEGSAYDQVCQHLTRIVALLDLQDRDDQILRAYDAICRRSLAFPLGSRLPEFSRINADGTPFQFATTMGVPFHTLQFLSEAGWPGASGDIRLRAGRECIATLASILGADEELEAAGDILSELAPETAHMLLTDPAGAFWIGAAFATSRNPQLRIYVNGSWGCENDRWARLRRFASHFGALQTWMEMERVLPPRIKHVGCALTLARGEVTTGRIYVSAYGNCMDHYEALARSVSGDRFAEVLRQYAKCLLGENYAYPTPTAVCSFGITAHRALDFKFELCSHCLFSSDVEASDKLLGFFDAAGIDAADYLQLMEVLSGGALDDHALRLHSYAGVGIRKGTEYFPVYLKPKLVWAK